MKEQPPQPAGSHLPQLDGLRALSVLAVMLAHFLPEGHWLGRIPLAGWGVRCFFVLSGYLITRILLESRALAEQSGSRRAALRSFYIRRSLRIFPVYFLTVALILALDVQHARETWAWLLTYTLNFHMAVQNTLYWSIAHFWTLCVEEQFYLAWPWVILLVPRRYLPACMLGAVALTPLFRLLAVSQGSGWYYARGIMPFSCTDSLGAGALIAWLQKEDPRRLAAWSRAGLLWGLPLYVLLTGLRALDISALGYRLFTTVAQSWFLFGVVQGAVKGYTGWVGRVLQAAPLGYIGKISYGIYIYHVFMILLVPWLLAKAGLVLPEPGVLHLVLLGAASILVAALSWHVYEKPLNDLKRFFPAR